MKSLKKSFTLIEVIIVMGVLAIMLPTIFSIVYVVIQQQLRVHRIVETKQQGDIILTYIKETISRESYGLSDSNGNPYCVTAGSSFNSGSGNIYFYKGNNAQPDLFEFSIGGGNIFYQEYSFNIAWGYTIVTSIRLNSRAVQVTDLFIECRKKDDNSFPMVSISYNVTFNDATPLPGEPVTTLHYHTKLKLRRTPN